MRLLPDLIVGGNGLDDARITPRSLDIFLTSGGEKTASREVSLPLEVIDAGIVNACICSYMHNLTCPLLCFGSRLAGPDFSFVFLR